MIFLVGNPSEVKWDKICKGCEIMKSQSGKIPQSFISMGRNSKTLWIVDRGFVGNLSQPCDQLVGENVETSPNSYFGSLKCDIPPK
jgi:hypothetical protein